MQAVFALALKMTSVFVFFVRKKKNSSFVLALNVLAYFFSEHQTLQLPVFNWTAVAGVFIHCFKQKPSQKGWTVIPSLRWLLWSKQTSCIWFSFSLLWTGWGCFEPIWTRLKSAVFLFFNVQILQFQSVEQLFGGSKEEKLERNCFILATFYFYFVV